MTALPPVIGSLDELSSEQQQELRQQHPETYSALAYGTGGFAYAMPAVGGGQTYSTLGGTPAGSGAGAADSATTLTTPDPGFLNKVAPVPGAEGGDGFGATTPTAVNRFAPRTATHEFMQGLFGLLPGGGLMTLAGLNPFREGGPAGGVATINEPRGFTYVDKAREQRVANAVAAAAAARNEAAAAATNNQASYPSRASPGGGYRGTGSLGDRQGGSGSSADFGGPGGNGNDGNDGPDNEGHGGHHF